MKQRFLINLNVTEFLLGCLNLSPRFSNNFKKGLHIVLLQTIKTLPLGLKILLTSSRSLIGSDEYSRLEIITSDTLFFLIFFKSFICSTFFFL